MDKWRPYRRGGRGGYDQNHGVAGVVYILGNDGFRDGYYKIGCSRRSGHARAFDLNIDASTGTPGTFRCIFEQRTVDCGRAERMVFDRLRANRRGKWGQEFFEVELGLACQTILAVCAEVDATYVAPPPVPRLEPSVRPLPASPPVGRYTRSGNLGAWFLGLLVLALFAWWVQVSTSRPRPVSQLASPTQPSAASPKPPGTRSVVVPPKAPEQAAHNSSPPVNAESAGLNEKSEQASAGTLTEPNVSPTQPRQIPPTVAEPQVSLDELARGRN